MVTKILGSCLFLLVAHFVTQKRDHKNVNTPLYLLVFLALAAFICLSVSGNLSLDNILNRDSHDTSVRVFIEGSESTETTVKKEYDSYAYEVSRSAQVSDDDISSTQTGGNDEPAEEDMAEDSLLSAKSEDASTPFQQNANEEKTVPLDEAAEPVPNSQKEQTPLVLQIDHPRITTCAEDQTATISGSIQTSDQVSSMSVEQVSLSLQSTGNTTTNEQIELGLVPVKDSKFMIDFPLSTISGGDYVLLAELSGDDDGSQQVLEAEISIVPPPLEETDATMEEVESPSCEGEESKEAQSDFSNSECEGSKNENLTIENQEDSFEDSESCANTDCSPS